MPFTQRKLILLAWFLPCSPQPSPPVSEIVAFSPCLLGWDCGGSLLFLSSPATKTPCFSTAYLQTFCHCHYTCAYRTCLPLPATSRSYPPSYLILPTSAYLQATADVGRHSFPTAAGRLFTSTLHTSRGAVTRG